MKDSGADREAFSAQLQVELLELANAALDGRLDGAQMARLEALLSGSEEARKLYVRFMTLSSSLVSASQDAQRAHQADLQLQQDSSSTPRQLSMVRNVFSSRVRRVAFISAAAACLVLAAVLSLSSSKVKIEPATPVASLKDTYNAVWSTAVAPRLGAGELHLVSGMARIDFDSGAVVRIEGPADFEIISASRGRLTRGKLVAQVPPQAVGFSISSPLVDVVDLGTMFGLDLTAVDAANQPLAAVHVFEGKVDISRQDSPTLQLVQNQAIALGSGADLRFDADCHVFQDWDFGDKTYPLHNHGDGHGDGHGPGFGPPPGGGPWRPTEVIFNALGTDSARRAVLEQKIERLVQAYRTYNGDPMMDDAVWHAQRDLFAANLQLDISEDDLAAKIAVLRDARANARQALEAAQQSLKEELTPQEEATLLLMGWLD